MKKIDADDKVALDQADDEWAPTAIHAVDDKTEDTNSDDAPAKRKANEISFKVTNPDGTERRMTKQEKKQLKYKLAQAKRDAQREKRQIKHEQLIQEAKKAKRERRELKRLERQERKKRQKLDDKEHIGQEQVCQEKSSPNKVENDNMDEEQSCVGYKEIDEELAAMRGERNGIPPAMLPPAATCVALEMKALQYTTQGEIRNVTTAFDRQLTSEWANEIQQSMIPAEELRAKEDMRPMAYKVVPEMWNRLCPLQGSKEDDPIKSQDESSITDELAMNSSEQCTLGLIRHPSSIYDRAAHAVFRHLNQHSNLHISSGGIFGCDFMLYDGKREDRHSFAGLRIYHCDKEDGCKFPLPSAYELTGFVRTMNTARKLALIATVIIDEGNDNIARILIVDLALEKILSVETHRKKGNTEKRKTLVTCKKN